MIVRLSMDDSSFNAPYNGFRRYNFFFLYSIGPQNDLGKIHELNSISPYYYYITIYNYLNPELSCPMNHILEYIF